MIPISLRRYFYNLALGFCLIVPISRTTASEGATMKARTKKKLSSDLRDLVKLTTLMWRLTAELCSNAPSLR